MYPTFSYGGGSYVAWELGKYLKRAGNDVCIISTDAGDGGRTPSGKFEEEGMTVYRVKNLSNSLAYQFKLFVPLIGASAIKAEVRRADIVHLHDFRTLPDLMVGKIAMDEGKPVVVQPHGTIRGDYLGRRELKGLIDHTVGNVIARGVRAWIALSKGERDHLIAFGIPEDRVRVIPNGIDLDRFAGRRDKGAARRELGIDPRKKVLLYLGRAHPFKGVDLLIDSVHELSESEKELMAVIAGPDDGALPQLKEQVRRLALSDRVIFKGEVTEAEKMNLFSASDAFVLPSKMEAFPISILEACSAGLPVITTRNSDIAAEIDGVCGMVVQRTKGDFVQAISRFIREEGLAGRLASATKGCSLKYSWEKIAEEYIGLYESIKGEEDAAH